MFKFTMSLLKKQENLIKEEKDLDTFTWVLMSDRVIKSWVTPYDNRRWHNYELRTSLTDELLPKATIKSLDKSLKNLSKHIEEKTSKQLVSILTSCRDYIDIYFNATHTNPMYVRFFYKWSSDVEILKRMINDARAWIDYFWGNVLSKNTQEHISVTSLYLREIIANTVWFNEVAHYPSQVKDKLPNYKLKAFLFDSHYSIGTWGNVVDSRKVAVED